MTDSTRPVIALLTDFGLSDPYVGMMKAAILEIAPDAAIIDISHDIRPQALRQGAFLLDAGLLDPTTAYSRASGTPPPPALAAPISWIVPNTGDPSSATPFTAATSSPPWPPISPPAQTSCR